MFLKAIEALKKFPTLAAQSTLKETILNTNFYYQVRIKAVEVLAHVCLLKFV